MITITLLGTAALLPLFLTTAAYPPLYLFYYFYSLYICVFLVTIFLTIYKEFPKITFLIVYQSFIIRRSRREQPHYFDTAPRYSSSVIPRSVISRAASSPT